MSQRWQNKIYMIPILLLATWLRVYNLDRLPNGLMVDEAMRGYDSYALALTGADSFGTPFPLFLRGYNDYVPALYSYLAAPFVGLLDLSVFSLRLTSVIMGILLIALAYQLIRHVFGDVAGLVGALLLAISPWLIVTNRIGLEWNLLILGTTATVTCAMFGLKRPYLLIVTSVIAGLTLYGYSPIKAFLPVLGLGFILIYHKELLQHKTNLILSFIILLILALPIYGFSLTSAGAQRFSTVYEGKDANWVEFSYILVRNYFYYFSPSFLFATNFTGIEGRPHVPIALNRLQSVGLLYWFELPLILLGLVRIVIERGKKRYFLLYWLLAAPIGINIHSASPAPYLWLTVIPIPQALAGAGAAWLIPQIKRTSTPNSTMLRPFAVIILTSILLGLAGQFISMYHDLFYKFPNYGASVWFYGRRQSILDMNVHKSFFDEVNLASEDLTSSIYLLFYTRYPPAQRQAELAETPDQTWQHINNYNIGNVRTYLSKPGCHLILTSIADAQDLQHQHPYLAPLRTYTLPDGKPVYGLYAYPNPTSRIIERSATFGETILLQRVSITAPQNTLEPDKAICLILQWQALNVIPADYTVFVHLIDSDGVMWAQHDSLPAHGHRPTSTWQPNDIIFDSHVLLPRQPLPPGEYSLVVGLYHSQSGERLTAQTTEGEQFDALSLLKLSVNKH